MKIMYVDILMKGHHAPYFKSVIKNSDYEIVLCAPEKIEDTNIRQIIVKTFIFRTKNPIKYWRWIKEIRDIAETEKPDVIHFLYGDLFYRFFGLGLSKFKSYKICHDISGKTYELIDAVDKAYIGDTIANDDKLNIINYCSEKGKDIYLIPSLYEISLVDFKVSQVDDLLVFKLEDLGLTYEQRFIKRTMDIFISSIGLIITSPVLLIVSLIIKLYDKGSVFYKQERVTENNKLFNLYKFRTMVEDAEKHTGPVLATDKDTRITPVGRFLRASRIDELPQLINVLRGDMSIVGPRPERPYFVEQFNEEIDGFKYRVYVKAGITGLAQILSNYSTDPKTKAKYDLMYIKNYSVLLDIIIIFNTVKTILLKDSSKGLAKEKELKELLNELNLKTYEEMGITKVDNI